MQNEALIWGVGVGPGDPGLLTVNAIKHIQACNILAFPTEESGRSRAYDTVKDYVKQDSTKYPFILPLHQSQEQRQQFYQKQARFFKSVAEKGQKVVVLCEGDPLLYGSFQYVLHELIDSQQVGIVPGISSVNAGAAMAYWPLISGNETMLVLPATLDEDQLKQQLQFCTTAIILKVGRHLPKIKKVLSLMSGYEQALLIENISVNGQRISLLHQVCANDVSYFSLILWRRETHD